MSTIYEFSKTHHSQSRPKSEPSSDTSSKLLREWRLDAPMDSRCSKGGVSTGVWDSDCGLTGSKKTGVCRSGSNVGGGSSSSWPVETGGSGESGDSLWLLLKSKAQSAGKKSRTVDGRRSSVGVSRLMRDVVGINCLISWEGEGNSGEESPWPDHVAGDRVELCQLPQAGAGAGYP